MRYIRYLTKNEEINYGWIKDNKVGRINGDIFGDFRREKASIPIEEIKLLAPISPGKIICLGRNYIEHAKEHGAEVPEIPLIFLKPPSAVIGPGEMIILPPQSTQVEHEAELGVVIGKKGRWISIENTQKHIFGFTIANDVTARDLQRRDVQWTRGKSFDTFCPLGPWIETDFFFSDALISCKVNDELRQMASTKEMVFSIPQIISFISSIMTLDPGDLILTGTPAGVAPLEKNDQIEITVEGIGTLTNQVGS